MATLREKQTYYSVIINGEIHDVTGRKRTPAGYVALCIRSHPNSDKGNGYVFEHRVVMEMKLGRYLNKNEVVHHKNEVKHDNRLENLELMDHVEHTVMHHTGSKRNQSTIQKMSQKARLRFSNKKNHPSYRNVDEELVSLIKEGKGPTEISKILKIARKTVYNKIQYLGVERSAQ